MMMLPAMMGINIARPAIVASARPLDALESTLLANDLVYHVGSRLLTSYTGSLIRVRRASDNTESDIGYTAGGLLDTAAVATFCGASVGSITTIYSQKGSNNLIMTTAGNQPTIYNGTAVILDGALISTDFLSSARTLEFTSFPLPSGNQNVTILSDANLVSSGSDQYVFFIGSENGGRCVNIQRKPSNDVRVSTFGPDVDLATPAGHYVSAIRYSMSEALVKGSTHTASTSAHASAARASIDINTAGVRLVGGRQTSADNANMLFRGLIISRQAMTDAITTDFATALRG